MTGIMFIRTVLVVWVIIGMSLLTMLLHGTQPRFAMIAYVIVVTVVCCVLLVGESTMDHTKG